MSLAALAVTLFLATAPPDAIQITEVQWKAGPPTLPKGTKVCVLEGDPKAAGMFTMRLKVPAGSVVEPHTHPRAERVTILSGEVRVGFGDQYSDSDLKSFGPGGFYVNP